MCKNIANKFMDKKTNTNSVQFYSKVHYECSNINDNYNNKARYYVLRDLLKRSINNVLN